MAVPTTLSINISGIEAKVAEIGGIRKRLANPTPAWRASANLLEKHVATVFSSEGVRGGARWRRLAPATVKARTRGWGYYRRPPTAGAGATSPILGWTGRLRKSFARGGRQHIRHIAVSGLTWGSTVRYGIFHDSPGPRTGKLPRRAILKFSSIFQQREILVRPLQLYLQGVPAGAIETVVGSRIGVGP